MNSEYKDKLLKRRERLSDGEVFEMFTFTNLIAIDSFENVRAKYYLTSDLCLQYLDYIKVIDMGDGTEGTASMAKPTFYLWPVRDIKNDSQACPIHSGGVAKFKEIL